MRFYLLRDNTKFARQLKASWAKLESRITQRHVEDGFLGWARYTAERKRTLILLDVSPTAIPSCTDRRFSRRSFACSMRCVGGGRHGCR